jgi:MoaA/NifB/PqqE/SkfB family radical SAM enzyme
MISCSIDISNACQNKCEFCLSSENLDGTFIDFDIYLNLIYDLHSMGVKSIVFSGGGEPLLHPQFKDIILAASSLNFRIGLFTNGIDLSKYLFLLPRFSWVKVSLDAGSPSSYKKIKGSKYFGRVIQNIIKTADKTDVTVGWVLSRDNASELFNIEDILPSGATISIKRDVRVVKRKPSIESCRMSDRLGIVTADSKVYYCPMTRWNNNYLLGDLRKNNIFEIWEKRKGFEVDVSNCNDCRFSTAKHDGFV